MAAFAQASFDPRPALELHAGPGRAFLGRSDRALGAGTPQLAVELGVALPQGSFFGYGLRLRAESIEVNSERPPQLALSVLAEAQVELGLELLAPALHPRMRGGLRIGKIGRLEGPNRFVLGPHLIAELGVELSDGGGELTFGAGAYVAIGPFELLPCALIGLRAPIDP